MTLLSFLRLKSAYCSSSSDVSTNGTDYSPSSSMTSSSSSMNHHQVDLCHRIEMISKCPDMEIRKYFNVGYGLPLFAVAVSSFIVARRITRSTFQRLVLQQYQQQTSAATAATAARSKELFRNTKFLMFPVEQVLIALLAFDFLTYQLVMPSLLPPNLTIAADSGGGGGNDMTSSSSVPIIIKQALVSLTAGIGLVAMTTPLYNRTKSASSSSLLQIWRDALITPGISGRQRKPWLLVGGLLIGNCLAAYFGAKFMSESRDRFYSVSHVDDDDFTKKQQLLKDQLQKKEDLLDAVFARIDVARSDSWVERLNYWRPWRPCSISCDVHRWWTGKGGRRKKEEVFRVDRGGGGDRKVVDAETQKFLDSLK